MPAELINRIRMTLINHDTPFQKNSGITVLLLFLPLFNIIHIRNKIKNADSRTVGSDGGEDEF